MIRLPRSNFETTQISICKFLMMDPSNKNRKIWNFCVLTSNLLRTFLCSQNTQRRRKEGNFLLRKRLEMFRHFISEILRFMKSIHVCFLRKVFLIQFISIQTHMLHFRTIFQFRFFPFITFN